MRKAWFQMRCAAAVACGCAFRAGSGFAETALAFDPGPPDQRPHYSCLGGPEYLVMCAAKWMHLVHDGQPTKSRTMYWHAAEFQGFVDGIAHTSIGRTWCPGVLESNDQVYTAVANYLMEREKRLPKDQSATEVVIDALSTWAPCKGSR
jgi:hypothetical protein